MKPPHLQNKVFYVNEGEVLSGFINHDKASDIEERAYRALVKRQIPSVFRFRINPMLGFTQVRMNIIGELEIDFLAQWRGNYYPLMIDGEISHFMAKWMLEYDAKKTIRINEALANIGARPVIRIPFTKLKDQRMADRTISEIFDYAIPVVLPPPPDDPRVKLLSGLGPKKQEYAAAKLLSTPPPEEDGAVERIINGDYDFQQE